MLFWNSFADPTDVDNLISGSSAFSKSSLTVWKFMVHVLLKPGLAIFEHHFANVRWVQLWGNLSILWHCLFWGIGMKTDLFQFCGHCWDFQIWWHIECSTFTASSFRIWNSSTGIPPPPLALFVVMLPIQNSIIFLLTNHDTMILSNSYIITIGKMFINFHTQLPDKKWMIITIASHDRNMINLTI